VLTDYHLHLRSDALTATAAEHFTQANAERYRDAASERGIAELGVSEHVYRFRQALGVWRHPFWLEQARDDLDAYCAFVREQTDLRLGIEADFVAGGEERMATLLAARDFDYVVGSVHFLRDRAVDMDDYSVWQTARSADEVWRRYFQTVGEAARSGLFDVIAHADLVKVWGRERPRPEGDLRRYYELALEGIADSGVAVELSTAGLRKRAGEVYPAPAFLQMCVDAGAPVALSSDAHRPEDVGACYEHALALLESMGVGELCVFERRERRLAAIGPADPTGPDAAAGSSAPPGPGAQAAHGESSQAGAP
jgi:histidinol-phosphatase (PHP family)